MGWQDESIEVPDWQKDATLVEDKPREDLGSYTLGGSWAGKSSPAFMGRQLLAGAGLGAQEKLEPSVERSIANLIGDQQTKDYYAGLSDQQIAKPLVDQNAQDMKDHPVLSPLMRVGGMAPAMAVGGALGEGALASAFGASIPLGVTKYNETGDIGEAAKDTAKGTALGYGLGKAFEAAVPAMSSTADWLSGLAGKFGKKANQVAAEEVLSGTQKQIQAMTDSGRTQAVGQWMRDNKVFGPFSSKEAMGEKVDALNSQYGTEIGDAISRADEAVSGGAGFVPAEQVAKSMREEVLAPLLKNPHLQEEAGQISSEIDNLETQYKGQYLSLDQMMQFKTALRNKTKMFQRASNDAMAGANRGMYNVYRNEIENGVEAAAPNGGTSMEDFNQSKANYGSSQTAQDILAGSIPRAAKNRKISLTDTIMGGAGIARGDSPLATALETAGFVSANKAMRTYGANWRASGLGGMEKLASLSSEELGSYLPVLQNALSKGAQNFSSTYYVLSSTDPEFRKITGQTQP